MHFAIAKLSAAAGLFLVTALDFGALRDRFFVRHLRRMKCDFDVVALLQFIDDCLNVKLARAGQEKFFGLRVAGEMKATDLLQESYESRR